MYESHQPIARPGERDRGGDAEHQRPPAPRAEHALVAGALLDLAVRVVLRTGVDPARQQREVGADHADEATDERDADGADGLAAAPAA